MQIKLSFNKEGVPESTELQNGILVGCEAMINEMLIDNQITIELVEVENE